ncbi:MAG: hypothetical protein K6A44_04900 [bacterium]|nr:hypothetical protein [bacterium]
MGLGIAKFENSLMNTGIMKKLTTNSTSGAIAGIALVSNLTKDAVNCYYYVTQSLNNKKIPEDKRKFVAGLDLSNGILNIITQTILGSQVIKWSDKVFEKWIEPKFYGEKAMNAAKSAMKDTPFRAIKEAFKENKSFAKGGMKVIATLVATQVVCKRIIVPLIATPMATYFRKKFEQNERKNNPNAQLPQDTVNFQNSVKKDDEVIHPIEHEKLPKCFQSFKSFMK